MIKRILIAAALLSLSAYAQTSTKVQGMTPTGNTPLGSPVWTAGTDGSGHVRPVAVDANGNTPVVGFTGMNAVVIAPPVTTATLCNAVTVTGDCPTTVTLSTPGSSVLTQSITSHMIMWKTTSANTTNIALQCSVDGGSTYYVLAGSTAQTTGVLVGTAYCTNVKATINSISAGSVTVTYTGATVPLATYLLGSIQETGALSNAQMGMPIAVTTSGHVKVEGPVASGSALGSAQPVPVSGSDGTNARTVKTDTSGDLFVAGPTASGSAATTNPVPIAGNDGTNVRAIKTDATGNLIPSSTANPICTSSVAVNQTTGTTVITGVSAKKIYICSIVLVSASTQSVSVVEGTGTVCATGIAALIGGTSASVSLTATGGFVVVDSAPWLVSKTNADNLCILQSASGNISGVISYVIQ